jgi:hypothetical protein
MLAWQRRSVAKVSPRFEILEARCLLSGVSTTHGPSWFPHSTLHNTFPTAVSVGSIHASAGDNVRTVVSTSSPPLVSTPAASSSERLFGLNGGAGAVPDAAASDSDSSPYLIVRETTAPHHTLQTAQALPDVPYFGVIGTIGGGDPIDLYRLTVGPQTSGFQFELVSQSWSSTVPLSFQLFDSAGKVVGTGSSSPDITGSPINFVLDNHFSGSTLFLGISAPGQNGAGAGLMTDYQLWVQQFTTPLSAPSPAGAVTLIPATTNALFVGAIVQPLTAVAVVSVPAPESYANPITTNSVVNGTGIEIRVGIESLPTHQAAPNGGVMSAETDIPAPALGLAAAITPEGAFSPRDTGSSSELRNVLPTHTNSEEARDGLIALSGPGGFPLLAADAIGNWQRTADRLPTAEVASVEGEQQEFHSTSLPPSDSLLPVDPDVLEQENLPADARSLPGRTTTWLWSSVATSLSVATLWTLNAVFSNPFAGYDIVPSRFDSGAGKLSRLGAVRGVRNSGSSRSGAPRRIHQDD